MSFLSRKGVFKQKRSPKPSDPPKPDPIPPLLIQSKKELIPVTHQLGQIAWNTGGIQYELQSINRRQANQELVLYTFLIVVCLFIYLKFF